jgi:hypothetical protein
MQPTIKIMMATIIVSLSLVAPGLAGLYEGNVATCKRGDKEMASTLIAKLAKQGAADGQTLLAWMYQYGIGVPHDHVKAVAWYRKAAEQGFALAQNNLGAMYAEGSGVPHDHVKAVAWYRKAAEQGLASAQYNFGAMYAEGSGVPHDDAKAVEWYRKAAEQGFAPAQYNLGRIYAVGHGVPQDYTMAHIWLNLAADRKNRNASEVMGLLARDMTPDQIAEAQRLAREWKPAQWMSFLRAFQNALSGCR